MENTINNIDSINYKPNGFNTQKVKNQTPKFVSEIVNNSKFNELLNLVNTRASEHNKALSGLSECFNSIKKSLELNRALELERAKQINRLAQESRGWLTSKRGVVN